jgi:hypothetical protein
MVADVFRRGSAPGFSEAWAKGSQTRVDFHDGKRRVRGVAGTPPVCGATCSVARWLRLSLAGCFPAEPTSV